MWSKRPASRTPALVARTRRIPALSGNNSSLMDVSFPLLFSHQLLRLSLTFWHHFLRVIFSLPSGAQRVRSWEAVRRYFTHTHTHTLCQAFVFSFLRKNMTRSVGLSVCARASMCANVVRHSHASMNTKPESISKRYWERDLTQNYLGEGWKLKTKKNVLLWACQEFFVTKVTHCKRISLK